MDWLAILNGALGAGGLAIILKFIDAYLNRGKAKAETVVLKSEASENISEAAQVAANVLLQALNFKQVENKEYQDRVKALEDKHEESDGLIKELQAHRDERTKQIEELQENNEALLSQVAGLRAQIAKDTAETQKLRNDYAIVQRDNIRLYEVTIGLAQAVETIKKAVQDAGIPLPINGEINRLLDSVYRMKKEREGRDEQ